MNAKNASMTLKEIPDLKDVFLFQTIATVTMMMGLNALNANQELMQLIIWKQQNVKPELQFQIAFVTLSTKMNANNVKVCIS